MKTIHIIAKQTENTYNNSQKVAILTKLLLKTSTVFVVGLVQAVLVHAHRPLLPRSSHQWIHVRTMFLGRSTAIRKLSHDIPA